MPTLKPSFNKCFQFIKCHILPTSICLSVGDKYIEWISYSPRMRILDEPVLSSTLYSYQILASKIADKSAIFM